MYIDKKVLDFTKKTLTTFGFIVFLLLLILITHQLTISNIRDRITEPMMFATSHIANELMVEITYPPFDGATGSGEVTLTADATSTFPIIGVWFWIYWPGQGCENDRCPIAPEDTTFPYSITTNSNQVPDGEYTIYAVASDQGGNIATAERIVIVNNTNPGGGGFTEPPPPVIPPVTVNLSAATTSLPSGSSTMIYWNSTGADSCNITKNGQSFSTATSSIGLNSGVLTSQTNFTATCFNSENTASTSLSVNIIAPIPQVTVNLFSATSLVMSESSTTISWSSTGADTCNVTKNGSGWRNGTSSTPQSSGSLTEDTIFIATCSNSINMASTSIKITVIQTPPNTPGDPIIPVNPISGGNGGGGGGGGGTEAIPIELVTSTQQSTTSLSVTESIKESYEEAIIIVEESIQKAVEVAEKTIEVTREVVNTPVGSVVTKTVSTTGVVAGASASISAVAFANPVSIAEIWLIPAKLFGILMGALGIRKKGRKWGTVFDSVTKRPLDPVYVSLIDVETNKEVFGSITDIDGRYGFLVLPGKYRIEVKKTNYISPSVVMKGRISDEVYDDLYFGEEIKVVSGGQIITKNIPMDSMSFDWNEFAKSKMDVNTFMKTKDIRWAKISNVLFLIGSLISLIAVVLAPAPYNFIIAVFYIFAYIFNHTIWKTKKSGILKEKNSNTPLSFAIVKIYREGESTPAVKKIADKFGAYYSLVPNGRYFLEIDKKNDDATYTNVLKTEVLDIKNGIINLDFEL